MKLSQKMKSTAAPNSKTVGIDLGDKFSHYCVIDNDGDVLEEGRVRTTPEGFTSHFQSVPKMRIAIETGTHSAWISQLLTTFGHEVIVANAGQIPAITGSDKKTDPNDAENLARFARFDPKLLHPVTHRDKGKQMDLTVVRVRARLVEVRTTLINSVRRTVKGFGSRLPRCDADSFAKRVKDALPAELSAVLLPLLEVIAETTTRIKAYDQTIEEVAESKYPEAAILRTIPGVGPIASLTFVLTIGDHGGSNPAVMSARTWVSGRSAPSPGTGIRNSELRKPGIATFVRPWCNALITSLGRWVRILLCANGELV